MRDPQVLISQGWGFVCACCDRLQRGLEAGSTQCMAAHAGVDCGGPLVGLSYPAYLGPLTRQTIATKCFRCGDEAFMVMEVKDGGHVGACKKHVNMTIPTCSEAMVPR